MTDVYSALMASKGPETLSLVILILVYQSNPYVKMFEIYKEMNATAQVKFECLQELGSTSLERKDNDFFKLTVA